MTTDESIHHVIRFGVFELDPLARTLTKRGRRVRLQGQPFETLVLLLERSGSIVTREELRTRLWPADTFVIFDDSLNTAVRKLREALGDSADSPRFIETIPRHGYRFIGSIERQPPLNPVDVAATASSGKWLWATVLPATLAVTLLILQPWRSSTRAEDHRTMSLTTLPGSELLPSLSPDGNHVVYTWAVPARDQTDIYVQMIDTGSQLRLTTTDSSSEFSPAWSPDGRWIAFLRAERFPPVSAPAGAAELRLVPALGGPERRLADIRLRTIIGTAAFIAWCPDSTCLLVTDSPDDQHPDALFVISVETGWRRQLTHPRHPLLGDGNPAVSPDGGSVVFRRVPAGSAGELHWLPLDRGVIAKGEPRRLASGRLNAEYPAWTPGGDEIVFSAKRRLWRLAIDADGRADEPTPLPFVGEHGTMPVISRSLAGRRTRLVYASSFTDANIWRFERPAEGLLSRSAVAIASTKWDINPDLSPDGQRLTFSSNRSGSMEVWLADTDGTNAERLTSMDAMTTTPRWSPDGQLIAFQSNRDGQFDIYVVPAAGGRPRNLTLHPANDHVPSFSRDGRWVYFSSTRSGDHRIWKVPTSGGDAVQVTDQLGFRPVEATDGYIYYNEGPGEFASLWRVPIAGGQPVRLLEGVFLHSFTVDQKGIYFVDRHANETRLRYYDFASSGSRTLAHNLGDITPLLTASADGRKVFLSRVDAALHDLVLVENFR